MRINCSSVALIMIELTSDSVVEDTKCASMGVKLCILKVVLKASSMQLVIISKEKKYSSSIGQGKGSRVLQR